MTIVVDPEFSTLFSKFYECFFNPLYFNHAQMVMNKQSVQNLILERKLPGKFKPGIYITSFRVATIF